MKAVQAVRQVREVIATTFQEDFIELEEACFQVQKSVSPVVCLPDEIVGDILEIVNEEWNSLQSPFTVAHISSRWRRIALSRQSLWRDLRILRCAKNICLDVRPMHLDAQARDSRLRDPMIVKATESFLAMARFCDKYSNHTLTHFEMAAVDKGIDLAQAALYIAAPSAQTLRGLRIVDTWDYIFPSTDNLSHIVHYFNHQPDNEEDPHYQAWLSTSREHSSLCLRALLIALQATTVDCLELCLSGLKKEHEPLFEAHLDSAPLRQSWPLCLTLSGFPFSCRPWTELAELPRTRSFFASLGSSVTALRLWTPLLSKEGFEPEFESNDMLPAILPAAVSTVCNLEMSSGWLNTAAFSNSDQKFPALASLQLLDADLLGTDFWALPLRVPWPSRGTIPNLREVDGFLQAFFLFADDQLRHAVLHCNPAIDKERLHSLRSSTDFQSLEHLHVIISSDFPSVDDENEFVEALFSWLLDDVAVVGQESHRTPCPSLKVFHLSRWDGSKPHDEEPSSRQHWEARCSISPFIGKLERSRRLRSQGLWSLPNKEQVKPAVPAAFRRGPQKSADSPSTASIPAITHPPSCVALEKIALSGCHIDAAVWAALQASPCEVTCDVDPFKMEKLPYAVEKKNRSRRTQGP